MAGLKGVPNRRRFREIKAAIDTIISYLIAHEGEWVSIWDIRAELLKGGHSDTRITEALVILVPSIIVEGDYRDPIVYRTVLPPCEYRVYDRHVLLWGKRSITHFRYDLQRLPRALGGAVLMYRVPALIREQYAQSGRRVSAKELVKSQNNSSAEIESADQEI